MSEIQYQEIIAMLTVLSKKIDKIERQINGGMRVSSDQSYLDELRREAKKIFNNITG